MVFSLTFALTFFLSSTLSKLSTGSRLRDFANLHVTHVLREPHASRVLHAFHVLHTLHVLSIKHVLHSCSKYVNLFFFSLLIGYTLYCGLDDLRAPQFFSARNSSFFDRNFRILEVGDSAERSCVSSSASSEVQVR